MSKRTMNSMQNTEEHKTARYFYVTAVDAKLYKSPRRSSSMVACEYVSRLSV